MTSLHDTLPGREQQRADIAQEAARLLAEAGIRDWAFAKQKAVSGLGLRRPQMPSNLEVAEALRAYLELFAGEETAAYLQELRALARRLMPSLSVFDPRVVGAAVSGLATQRSPLELHLFSDPAEQVDIFLADRGWPYEEDEARLRHPDGRELILPMCCLGDGRGPEVEITIFSQQDRRWSPASIIDGRPMTRWSLEELQAAS
nr:hypothetical protein [Oceanococcus sp. HetDA_MAG_MS8]